MARLLNPLRKLIQSKLTEIERTRIWYHSRSKFGRRR